jgi:release factor glutamine methyltransferase
LRFDNSTRFEQTVAEMTVLEAIQKSREFLEGKGVESARLESELLLGQVLKLPRLQLYLKFDRELNGGETAALRELVKRRGTREPLQHILGSAGFCGLEIAVNRDVLVPRPETEILAEHGWKFLNGLSRPATFLDFGTGSGCIAIALCRKAKEATGVALDQSDAALEVAQRNAAANHVVGRLRFARSDGFSGMAAGSKFDLIISNPPYIATGEIAALQIEVRDFDPRPALDGGTDGLDFYRLLAGNAGELLEPGGKLMVEFGDGQKKGVAELLEGGGWIVETVELDFTKRPRVLIARTG